MVAMILEDMLVDLGHTVVATVGRLEAAKKIIGDKKIDLALLDVNLNGVPTYPLAEALEARGIPFVFATGYGAAGIDHAWRDAHVLQKPYDIDQLRDVINAATQGARRTHRIKDGH